MSSKSLYTVIADYKGGTYCSQVHAQDEAHAFKEWIQAIPNDTEVALQFTSQGIKDLERIDWNNEDRPGPLNGLINAWCSSIILNEELCLINIIQTWTHDS